MTNLPRLRALRAKIGYYFHSNTSIILDNKKNIIKLKEYFLTYFKQPLIALNNKDNLNNGIIKSDYFNENVKNKIIENQFHFCKNQNLFKDRKIETKITKVKVNYNNVSFNMFVYNNNDVISESIKNIGIWEGKQTNNLLNCLNYYSTKRKLNKNEITVIDLGANVGWYSFFLGNAGFEIISFEISNINNYILKKNFCLNNYVNITIINKGIGLEEEKCILHHPSINIGNGVILCGENANIPNKNEFLTEEVTFTKFSNYIPFLSNKNLALIKIDIEGSEGKAINSGIELITKYHIPFIFTEFTPDYLKMQGTDPKNFLQLFENNGYKISLIDFLSKKYTSINELLKLSTADLYIIYNDFLEKE